MGRLAPIGHIFHICACDFPADLPIQQCHAGMTCAVVESEFSKKKCLSFN